MGPAKIFCKSRENFQKKHPIMKKKVLHLIKKGPHMEKNAPDKESEIEMDFFARGGERILLPPPPAGAHESQNHKKSQKVTKSSVQTCSKPASFPTVSRWFLKNSAGFWELSL